MQEHTIGWLALIATVSIAVTIGCAVAAVRWVMSVEDRLEAQEIYNMMLVEHLKIKEP